MGQTSTSLIAELGINEDDFIRGLNASESRLSQTQEKAKLLAAQMALLQVEMAKENSGKGTQVQIEQYKGLETALRSTRKEAVEMKRHLDALQTVKVDAAAKAAAEPVPAPLVKVTPQTNLSGSSSSSAAPIKVVLPEPKTPEPYGPPAPPKRSKPEDEPDDEPEANNRMRNMELGHVARSAFDSLASGQSLGRTAMQEGPRLLQAFGSSLGSLVTWLGPLGLSAGAAALGVGAAVKVLSSAHDEAVRLTDQIDKSGRPQASLGGDTQEAARARLESTTDPIAKLQEKADSGIGNFLSNLSESITDKVRPATQAIAGFYNQIYQVVGLGGKLDAGGFIADKGTTRENALAQAKGQQAVAVNRYAATQERDNALDEKGFSQGEDQVAKAKLEQLFKQRKDAIEKLVADNPAIGDTKLVAALREEIDLREKIATLAHETLETSRHYAREQVQITHPGIRNSEFNSTEKDHPDPNAPQFRVPREMQGSHAVQQAESKYHEALNKLQLTRAQGGDDRAATTDVMRAEGALHDAAITRQQMSPEERNEADRKQRQRDQVDMRLGNPGTHDADKQGSYIHNADDPGGSFIPDAGSGTGAIDSSQNAHAGDRMPDRSFTMPDRRPLIDAGAQNAGKGDVAGQVDNAGIISALGKVETAVKGISFKNRA